jgi:hypothetical protein
MLWMEPLTQSYTSFLDVIAFVMIAVCSCKSANSSSSLLRRVVQDATVYFLMIVWVQLTVMIYVARMGSVSFIPPTHDFILWSLPD